MKIKLAFPDGTIAEYTFIREGSCIIYHHQIDDFAPQVHVFDSQGNEFYFFIENIASFYFNPPSFTDDVQPIRMIKQTSI